MAWDEEDTMTYQVVVNHEKQYSIWPDYKAIPQGWWAMGNTGKKDACLAYVLEVWTDMRPLSLRRQMAAAAQQKGREQAPAGREVERRVAGMSAGSPFTTRSWPVQRFVSGHRASPLSSLMREEACG